jgi:hypothetical protein
LFSRRLDFRKRYATVNKENEAFPLDVSIQVGTSILAGTSKVKLNQKLAANADGEG